MAGKPRRGGRFRRILRRTLVAGLVLAILASATVVALPSLVPFPTGFLDERPRPVVLLDR